MDGRVGDQDGDGFLEYSRENEDGLANQGWKDLHRTRSFTPMGRLPKAPSH